MITLYKEARRDEMDSLEAGRLVNILQTISNSFKEHEADYRIAQLETQIEKLTQIIDRGPRLATQSADFSKGPSLAG